jgi:hypothetical protein
MDDYHEFQEERSPKDTVVLDVETCNLERQHLPVFVLPVPHDTSRSMRPMGVDACPGMIPWNMSCTGVRSDKLRPISMKVFLIMRFNEVPLSINVLATLCHPIRILTTSGKFLSDSSVTG